MFYNEKLKGEIATTLTIVAVILMGAGALIGSKLTQQPQTISSKAADDTCTTYLSTAPQLRKEGTNIYCDVAINNPPNPPPTRINCALINPSRSSDSQILTDSVFFRWYGAGETPSNTLRFQLSQRSDYTARLSPGNAYRLVAYRLAENWSTSLCDKTQDYTSLSSFFGGTAAPTNPPTQPTATQATAAQPTWTPIPTKRPTSTSTPTPTTKPDAQATATPTPSPAQILDSCKGIESVSVSPATVGLNSAFNCIVRYDTGTSEKNIVCGLHKEDVDQWWPPACDTVPASGGTVTFPCSTDKAEISSLIGNGGQFRLFAFHNLPECTKGSNPFFALGVKQSGVFQIGQQSSSQTNLSSANVKMQSNCPAQPKMAQNYAQITVSGKTALIQTNLKADNQFNRLDANCL